MKIIRHHTCKFLQKNQAASFPQIIAASERLLAPVWEQIGAKNHQNIETGGNGGFIFIAKQRSSQLIF